MLLNSYTIIITPSLSLLPLFLSSVSLLTLLPTTMSLNPMAHHHPQAWYWEPSMAPFHQGHHHSYHVEHAAEDQLIIEREHMFEKPLTPSDVGKLNRLVIPKQHAERHFPLDGDSWEKGLLLCFEDESGKSWRFRYSYWTSSQSYVLTKGWSRFVKEKRLDAGDVVVFQRLRAGGDRLYIGCRRRGANETAAPSRATAPWGSTCYAAAYPYPMSPSCPPYVCHNSVQQEHCNHAGEQRDGVAESPAMVAPANSKRLRLFGVNLDCFPEPESQPPLSSSSWFSELL